MKKRIVLVIIVLIVIISSSIVLIYPNRDFFLNDDEVTEQSQVRDVVNEYIADLYVNIADHAIMRKGKLLNAAFKKEYNKLPDTLYTLKFGDKLYPLFYEEHKNDNENNWFSPIDEHSFEVLNKHLDSMVDIWGQKNMVDYLNLVAKKAVSPPVYDCSGCIYTDINEFDAYYKDEFSSNGMSQLPLVLKEKIIEFYNSEEGKEIRYVEKGNQTSADLIWSGNLTGSGKNEYVILFKDTEYELSDNYLLLVYAANETDYYLVYSEKFYDKVLLEHLKTSSDGEENIRKIYMNTDYLVETDHDGVVIKQINRADKVLVYNAEFDKMVGYYQRSASEIKKEQEEFNEEDAEEVDDI